jgi:hypothetical protein
MERRTRLDKVVGSYKRPLPSWTYWSENDWTTGEPGYVVVAPSGARIEWVASEGEAQRLVAIRNEHEA